MPSTAPTITHQRLPVSQPGPVLWDAFVRAARQWGDAHGLDWRNAVVLLPFVSLLPLARQAWADAGGWMPRIETTQTLSAALHPARPPEHGQLSFDVPTDRLQAAAMLRAQSWTRASVSADPRYFEQAVAALVEVAQGLARAAAAVPPLQREEHWLQARALLSAVEGPARSERLLARVALEWAAAGAPPASDTLFALQPCAWIVLRAGGPEPLSEALLQHAGRPGLLLDADVPPQAPFAEAGIAGTVEVGVCDSFEEEAQRSAARILAHLRRGEAPVALIAQDRSLVRRVRALLARRLVPLLDETGWRLSTTRAAAHLAALLRALRPAAASDDVLDWLKASRSEGPGMSQRARGTPRLESALRRNGWARWGGVVASRLPPSAASLHAEVEVLRTDVDAGRSRTLAAWRDALRQALQASGDDVLLAADDAGMAVLAALHLDDADGGSAWGGLARELRMDFDDFIRWVDTALEESTFMPPSDTAPQVVITPLARAMLRPFAAIVMPGADERHLGAGGSPWPLLGDAEATALGLASGAQRRECELLAFAQLLRAPRLAVLRRRREGSEPLAASPLLERLALALGRQGMQIGTLEDEREWIEIRPRRTPRPTPAAAALLPAELSATSVDALRTCPYRFFAQALLRLREPDELDETIEKRDYGTWLHAVLHRFHRQRLAPSAPDVELEQLQAAAAAEQARMGLDPAEFLPYAASFDDFAPRYVDWLHGRDAEGARWQDGELELAARPQELAGIELRGRIDRIDAVAHQGAATLQLIDYKTGSAEALKTLLKQPAEDTQLAFYAALMSRREGAPGQPLQAVYLPLDSRDGIRALAHADVEHSARLLVEGLGRELESIRGGAAMPALGEGRACEFCNARGLCRRDDWTPDE